MKNQIAHILVMSLIGFAIAGHTADQQNSEQAADVEAKLPAAFEELVKRFDKETGWGRQGWRVRPGILLNSLWLVEQLVNNGFGNLLDRNVPTLEEAQIDPATGELASSLRRAIQAYLTGDNYFGWDDPGERAVDLLSVDHVKHWRALGFTVCT